MNLYIVMGTYNGENFIATQIESILKQTISDFRLLIRDDGSTDSTCAILSQLANEDSRIEILNDTKGNLGAAFNFEILINEAYIRGADFIAFSDQDDYWLENKLKLSLIALKSLSSDLPALVHTDLSVVNESLQVKHSSFMKYQGIHHVDKKPINVLLVQNFVTGCTTIINRKLVEISRPFPKEIVMHDWWLALCAGAFGEIKFVEQATVLYRQHASNVIGAKSHIRKLVQSLNLVSKSTSIAVSMNNFLASLAQAKSLKNFILDKNLKKNRFNNTEEKYVDLFLTENNILVFLAKLVKYKIYRQKIYATIGLYLIAVYVKFCKIKI